MMITKKQVNGLVQGMLAAVPTIPYIMRLRPRRTPITAYVLSGVGFAIAGGLAAVMLLSPRIRRRALGVAKDTYEKVNEKVSDTVGHLHVKSQETPIANGIAAISNHTDYAPTTGL